MILKLPAVVVIVFYLSVVVVLVLRDSSSYDEENVHVRSTTVFTPESREDLLRVVLQMNTQQRIYNENLFGNTLDLVIVVQVHKRPLYLQKLINSLENTPSINKTLLIFSHDWIDQTLDDVVHSIKFAKILQIFYPFSIQTHPGRFPGPDPKDCVSGGEMIDCPNFDFKDSFGHFRNPSMVQIKHHWWWKANFVFKEVKILRDYNGLVLFVEEDHYLAPDFIHCLNLMTKTSNYYCPNCWFYSLGTRNRVNFGLYSDRVDIGKTVENLGLAFNRTVWNKVSQFREHFCKFDDYNWDWSLKNLYENIPEEKNSMVMVATRVYHVGSCGTHFSEEICDPTEAIKEFQNRQVNLFPDSFYVMFGNQNIVKSHRNGGWGDPRDQNLCMEM